MFRWQVAQHNQSVSIRVRWYGCFIAQFPTKNLKIMGSYILMFLYAFHFNIRKEQWLYSRNSQSHKQVFPLLFSSQFIKGVIPTVGITNIRNPFFRRTAGLIVSVYNLFYIWLKCKSLTKNKGWKSCISYFEVLRNCSLNLASNTSNLSK